MKIIILLFMFAGCSRKKDTLPQPSIAGLDPAFEKYLVDHKIDKDGLVNGKMNTSDARGIDSLEIPSLEIRSLQGIEIFSDLEYLNCGGNQLTYPDLAKTRN